jgi:phosphatidylglycerophosphatase A
LNNLTKIVASFFYLGYIPIIPGTFGSLGGLTLYFLVKDTSIIYTAAILIILALGMAFCGRAEKLYGEKDSRFIVIDEVCGMLISLYLVPYSLWVVIIGFLLFRFFDIIKPPPAKKIENASGSFGVMFDDVFAAVYANIALQILTRIFHFF